MKKKKEGKEPNHERWLLTYSDLITLLMVFFVVMFAMSNIDASKYKQVANSLSVSMGGGKTIIGNESASSISDDTKPIDPTIQEQSEEAKMENLKAKVDKYLEQNGMKSNVTTQMDERGLVVSLNDTLFFDTAKADVKPEAQKKLVELGRILNGLDNSMRVEGHTDNVPISNYPFTTNWQLSALRAANVVQLLVENSGIPGTKITSAGLGEYRPVADNSTEDGKAKNRRVDIIIVNSKFNKMEKGTSSKGTTSNTNIQTNSSKTP